MDKVIKIVESILGEKAKNIIPLNSGIISKSYSFDTDEKKCVIRFSNKKADFEKDLYAYNNFASVELPIPKIIKNGVIGRNEYYSVSERCTGDIVDNLPDSFQYKLLPQVVKLQYCIKSVKIDTSSGFGLWSNGKAVFKTWETYLLDVENKARLFLSNVDQDNIMAILKILKANVKYLPNSTYLIHGDLGFNNILSDGISLTGIIDWGDSKYGDFVYDIAWLIFWASEIPYYELFKNYYKSQNDEIDNYEERVNCYLCHIGLMLMIFFIKSMNYNDYSWVSKKLAKSFV